MEGLVWVREEVVRAIHLRQLAEHGGPEGVRDASALARPRNLLAYSERQPDMATLAAAHAFGIARNDPFVDGNKRVAFIVCRTFLLLNGRDLDASGREKFLTFLSVAEGRLSETELAIWIREHLCEVGAEPG